MIEIGELILAGFFFFTPVQSAPVEFSNSDIDNSVVCLALNMYYEARGQGTVGLLAVSYVVLNRVRDKRFPILYVRL